MQDEDAGRLPPHGGLALCAVPLRREGPTALLRDWQVPARGARVVALEQRPPPDVRDTGLARIATADGTEATVDALLRLDSSDAHLGTTRTDRLVPRHLLAQDDGFVERNLGGWSPLWFGVLATVHGPDGPDDEVDDPVLAEAVTLARYGDAVDDLPVPRDLLVERCHDELGDDPAGAAATLQQVRRSDDAAAVAALVAAARGEGAGRQLPYLLAVDELLERLYRLELARRHADAELDDAARDALAGLQDRVADEHGLRLLLKGEYVMGRHRRSTVLLAEGLGVVVKQPAPEPSHDVELGARSHDGLEENWPAVRDGGRVLTPRGAIARVVGVGAVERLNEVFGRDVRFSVALGVSVEPFAPGPTLAELAVERPSELTAERYDQVLVHHLVCEQLGVDNPDWHAANFMVTGEGLVHVDWGAARSIDDDERGPRGARARLAQVRELAWSFQDEDLAERTAHLHEQATSDEEHMDGLRARARGIAAG